jgi:hypothetical protein
MPKTHWLIALSALTTAACATAPPASPQAAFFQNLQTLCGKTAQGRAVAFDPALDESFLNKPLVMGPVACAPDSVSIPFAVGDDRSRTWRVSRASDHLHLVHIHKHGETEDTLSRYGGAARDPGDAVRQTFPADEVSKAMFLAEGRAVSVANVWAVEVEQGKRFAYELRRPERFFRIEFDLSDGGR